jgi:hypothetical protein
MKTIVERGIVERQHAHSLAESSDDFQRLPILESAMVPLIGHCEAYSCRCRIELVLDPRGR